MTHSWRGGSQKRIYRVTHPDQVEAVRYAIGVMGEGLLPSDRARAKRGEKREVEYDLACEDL